MFKKNKILDTGRVHEKDENIGTYVYHVYICVTVKTQK